MSDDTSGKTPDSEPTIDAAAIESDPALHATATTLARRWTLRVWIIAAIGGAMFIWGLIDAMWVYPGRGMQAAEYLEFQYLRAADKSGKTTDVSVSEPVAELARLEERQKQNVLSGEVELARMNWLEALKNAGGLKASNTAIENWRKVMAELDVKWGGASAKPPQALEAYDLPVQWAITGAGLIVLVWRLATAFPIIFGRKYSWDLATHTLTMPGGATLVPEDITEFDKRKWDKFLVTLAIRDGHATFSGKKLTLDTYMHNELEPWILEMERVGPTAKPEPVAEPKS